MSNREQPVRFVIRGKGEGPVLPTAVVNADLLNPDEEGQGSIMFLEFLSNGLGDNPCLYISVTDSGNIQITTEGTDHPCREHVLSFANGRWTHLSPDD